MKQRVAVIAASLLALFILPSASEMDATAGSCPSPEPDSSKSLMQRRKELLTHLAPRHKHPKAQNSTRHPSSQVANLLAQEMEDLAASKGQMGLSPEEIEHINSIKDMIVGSILPSITDGVEETREEVKVLFDAITSCANHATDALQDIAQLESDTESNSDSHGTCRKKEDEIITEKDRVCGELEQAKKGVHKPELDFEVNMDISDEDMIRYLRAMEDHFCGRWSEFKKTWEECEDLTDNYTKTNQNCVTLQQDLEESWCTWKMELEETCEEFDSCWSAAVDRYNERKEAIETLQETRLNEYKGALKVNCYWDAWKWDAEPCTIDEDKMKECKEEYEPDLDEVLITFPELPTPPTCDTEPVSIYPCTEEYIAEEYASLGVSAALLGEMKDMCSSCAFAELTAVSNAQDLDPAPPAPEAALAGAPTPAPAPPAPMTYEEMMAALRAKIAARMQGSVVRRHVMTGTHMENVEGDIWTKDGGSGCDGILVSPDSDDTSVKARLMDGAKGKLEIFSGETFLTMDFDNNVAKVGDISHTFSNNEVLSIEIKDGKAIFMTGQKELAQVDAPFEQGTAKFTMCTMGASVEAIDW